MRCITVLCISCILIGIILTAGCTQQQPAATQTPSVTAAPATSTMMPDSIKVMTNPQHGQYLTDAAGMTLYYFTKDIPGNGMSACTGGCLAIWPVFHTQTVTVSAPLSTSDFGEIIWPDGTKQTTWKGWPLYYYKSDAAAGDIRGQGVNNIWFVISPSGIVTMGTTVVPTTAVPTTATPTTPTPKPTTTAYSSGSNGGGGY